MNKQERLKIAYQYLKNKGVVHTQKDMAEAMGASEPNVSSAFKGVEKVLTDNFLGRFARTFNISLDWLLTGCGEMLMPNSQHVTGNENTSVNGGHVTTVGNIGGATNSPVTVNGAGAELSKMLDELREQNRSQREQIQSLTEIIKNLTAR